jgi:hypothetical protein
MKDDKYTIRVIDGDHARIKRSKQPVLRDKVPQAILDKPTAYIPNDAHRFACQLPVIAGFIYDLQNPL